MCLEFYCYECKESIDKESCKTEIVDNEFTFEYGSQIATYGVNEIISYCPNCESQLNIKETY
tara:strand:+ start:312 stop:497 length:186 start_codon:yes stop_codon:yes gene_type:complete